MTERFIDHMVLLNGGDRQGKDMATKCYKALFHLISTREILPGTPEELLQLIDTDDKDCRLPTARYNGRHTHLFIPHETLLALKNALNNNPALLYEAVYQRGVPFVRFGPEMMQSINFGLSMLDIV